MRRTITRLMRVAAYAFAPPAFAGTSLLTNFSAGAVNIQQRWSNPLRMDTLAHETERRIPVCSALKEGMVRG
jgi:hypothetical protein